MKKIIVNEADRKELVTSLKKIIGQLNSVISYVENDNISGQTFTQLLAVKGGASRVCKDIISKGVVTQLDKYSKDEIDKALNIIFKLD